MTKAQKLALMKKRLNKGSDDPLLRVAKKLGGRDDTKVLAALQKILSTN